jgi:hypothetical protein
VSRSCDLQPCGRYRRWSTLSLTENSLLVYRTEVQDNNTFPAQSQFTILYMSIFKSWIRLHSFPKFCPHWHGRQHAFKKSPLAMFPQGQVSTSQIINTSIASCRPTSCRCRLVTRRLSHHLFLEVCEYCNMRCSCRAENVYSRSRRCVSGLDQWTTNTICFYEAICPISQRLCNMMRNFTPRTGVSGFPRQFLSKLDTLPANERLCI